MDWFLLIVIVFYGLVGCYIIGLFIYGFFTLRGDIQGSFLHDKLQRNGNPDDLPSNNGTLRANNELNYVIGDLLEEFNEIPSRMQAHIWLYKQILKL